MSRVSAPLPAIAIVLHAHLPYVPATEGGQSLEERWLYQALWECYLPLLDVLERLDEDGVPARWTVSLSPTLIAMLGEARRREAFGHYLDERERFARDARDRPGEERLRPALEDVVARLEAARRRMSAIGGDVTSAFAAQARGGHIDLMTTAATHAYLPALGDLASVRRQLCLGAAAFTKATGLTSEGRWLPECGFEPRLEAILAEEGVRFTVLDAHGLGAGASPFAVARGGHGVAFFPRDPSTARRVWSRAEGYPRDAVYREYYAELEAGGSNDALGSGIKPYRISGPGSVKEPYDPRAAAARAAHHAEDFVEDRWRALRASSGPRPPVAVAPFDAELFGHWWSEGPQFLEAVARALHRREGAGQLRSTTLGAWLDAHPPDERVDPLPSSWGEGGFGGAWFGPTASRYVRHVRHAGEALRRAMGRAALDDAGAQRALDQCVRELVLAQASDWPFMAERGEVTHYAIERLEIHTARALRLAFLAERGALGADELLWLAAVERQDAFLADLRGDALRESAAEPRAGCG